MDKVKKDYLDILQEYINEKMYITSKTDTLEKEIKQNCWWINGTKEQIASLSVVEWRAFIQELINDRKVQLKASKQNVDMIFYCWFDDMSGELRFNLINSNHAKLPFNCKINFVSLDQIIEQFYFQSYRGVIPMSDLEILGEVNDNEDDINNEDSLNVYKKVIFH